MARKCRIDVPCALHHSTPAGKAPADSKAEQPDRLGCFEHFERPATPPPGTRWGFKTSSRLWNFLVHALRSDSSHHQLCRNWLSAVVNGGARFGIAPQVLSGEIHITTHSKVFAKPSRLEEAIGFCDLLISQPHCVVVQPGKRHWHIFKCLCTQADARGSLVPDAWLAALAIESGFQWITLDRDYARFPGLQWRVPA